MDDFSFSFFFSSLLGMVTLLIILLLVGGLVMIFRSSTCDKGLKLYRFLLGAVFIFSGFVKADDPLGFSYKLNEYFEAFGPSWKWAMPLSFPLACALPIIEMVIGLMVLIGARKKLTLWLLFLMDLFFTFLTYYTAHYNKVLECGCFGDAIPMTPWVTFWKDVVLLAMIGIIALFHKRYSPAFSSKIESSFIVVFLAASISFTYYCYNYLPVIDFRPYKIGTDIKKDMQGVPDVLKYYYTLKNKKTNEVKEFEKFPENYQNDWDYLNNRTVTVKKGIEPKIKDFNIVSPDGTDYTDSVLNNPSYNLLLISSTIAVADKHDDVIKKVNDLAAECMKHHVKFICLTASSEGEINAYKDQYHVPYPFFSTDETVLRTMIRSNPGLILLKAGIVIDMWHFHSMPDYKMLNEKYFHL
ncbi:MAG TPA: BT_3928 family protein [Bacteroidia bacterium]|nr:BT_3928 family protein [Bacteroidia bacterium]